MARMCGNGKISSKYFGDSSQLTKYILDLEAMCHKKPQV